MKTIIFLLLAFCYICYVGATWCYICNPEENNGFCEHVNETTPIEDWKNDLGCYVYEEKGDDNITRYVRNVHFPSYDDIDCDAVKVKFYRGRDAKCTTCKSDFCNSSHGIKPTILTFAIAILIYIHYNL